MFLLSSLLSVPEWRSMALLTVIGAWFQVSHTRRHLLRAVWSPLLWGKQAKGRTELGLANSIPGDMNDIIYRQSIPLSPVFLLTTFLLQMKWEDWTFYFVTCFLQNVVVEWLTLLLRIREVPSYQISWSRVFVVFLSLLRRMSGYYLKIRPRPLPEKFFPIHRYSLITLSSTLCSLVTEKTS
jgi:hypothetical protein